MENYSSYLSKYNQLNSTPNTSINFDLDVPIYTPIDNTISNYSIEKIEPKKIPKLSSNLVSEPHKEPYSIEKNWDTKVGYMSSLINLMKEEQIPFKVSSGFRQNAITNNGNPSWHSKGYAIDIVPSAGTTWNDLKQKLYGNKRIQQWMKDNNMGMIDETGKSASAKFGATGANIHIGKDEYAKKEFWNTVGRYQWGGEIPKKYVVKTGDTLGSISQLLNVSKDSLTKYSKITNPNKINTGDELYYYVKPSLGQNLTNFFFESPEDNAKKLMTKFQMENNVTDKQIYPSTEISTKHETVLPKTNTEKAEDIALKFITGKDTPFNGWESFSSNPYFDTIGKKWTVGFGYALPDANSYQKISKEKAYELTSKIINESIIPNLQQYKGFNKLDTNMKAALIDAVYGLGPAGFSKSTNLIKLIANNAPKEELLKEMNWNINSKDGRAIRTKGRISLAKGNYNWKAAPYSKESYEN